jgi:hypothetical protein
MYPRPQNRPASGMQNRRPNERSKTRPKTALQIPETSIYWQIVIRKTSKKGVQIDLQNGGQKYGPKHVRGEGVRDRIFVRRTLNKRQFGARISPNAQKLPEITQNPMKQAISGAMADRKRTMKIEPKNRGKNGSQIQPKSPPKIQAKTSSKTQNP